MDRSIDHQVQGAAHVSGSVHNNGAFPLDPHPAIGDGGVGLLIEVDRVVLLHQGEVALGAVVAQLIAGKFVRGHSGVCIVSDDAGHHRMLRIVHNAEDHSGIGGIQAGAHTHTCDRAASRQIGNSGGGSNVKGVACHLQAVAAVEFGILGKLPHIVTVIGHGECAVSGGGKFKDLHRSGRTGQIGIAVTGRISTGKGLGAAQLIGAEDHVLGIGIKAVIQVLHQLVQYQRLASVDLYSVICRHRHVKLQRSRHTGRSGGSNGGNDHLNRGGAVLHCLDGGSEPIAGDSGDIGVKAFPGNGVFLIRFTHTDGYCSRIPLLQSVTQGGI